MASKDWQQVVTAFLIGVAFWVYGYQWHKKQQLASPFYHQLFHAPRWLVMLSGKPRPDDQLEVGAVVFQLVGILLFLLPSVMVILKVDFSVRAVIITLVAFGLPVGGLCARVLFAIVRR